MAPRLTEAGFRVATLDVFAAAKRPDLVDHTVLIGPFVRDVPVPFLLRLLVRVLFTQPLGPSARVTKRKTGRTKS